MDNVGKNVDIKKLCRMCAKPLNGKCYINLLSSNENNRPYVMILKHHTGVLVNSSDELSTFVCTNCLNNLAICDKTRSAVLRAQAVLDSYLDASSNKTDKLAKQSVKQDLKVNKENIMNEQSSPMKFADNTFIKSELEMNTDMPAVKIVKQEPGTWTTGHTSSPRVATQHISLPCRVCLNTFTAVTFINHVCDTSKLIPCKKCRLNFKTKEELTEHEESEHKKKKGGRRNSDLTCIHCDVNFVTPEALERHLLRVGRQSQKIFNCDYCTNFYMDEKSCDEHMEECSINKKLKL